MKIIKFLPLLALIAGFTACRKNYDGYYDNRGSTDHPGSAANMVASSFASDADGIVSLAGNVTLNAQNMINAHSSCGTIKSDSTTTQSQSGASTSYTYTNKDNLVVLCNSSSQPDSAVNTSNYNGSFSNANLTSTNSGSSIFYIGGLLSTSTTYTVNGEYKRAGSYQANTGNKSMTSSNIDIVLNGLLVDKRYRSVIGGTAYFTITGTDTSTSTSTNSNANYNYTGTVTFSNTNYALLTLNGTNYKVNLTTGAVTQQ